MVNFAYNLIGENELLGDISNNTPCRTLQYFSGLHLQK